jgi:hypothetical protein
VRFGQHYDVGFDLFEFSSCVLPKVCRHFAGRRRSENRLDSNSRSQYLSISVMYARSS